MQFSGTKLDLQSSFSSSVVLRCKWIYRAILVQFQCSSIKWNWIYRAVLVQFHCSSTKILAHFQSSSGAVPVHLQSSSARFEEQFWRRSFSDQFQCNSIAVLHTNCCSLSEQIWCNYSAFPDRFQCNSNVLIEQFHEIGLNFQSSFSAVLVQFQSSSATISVHFQSSSSALCNANSSQFNQK